MSTTTRCLFALGLSVSLIAACGDDDDDGFGGGGSSGRAGGGGSGGRAGAAGAAGAAGNGGDAGSSGSGGGGSGGTGGTGGSNGGTGGSNGGSGGSTEPGDAGPDATVDGGDVVVPPVDAGPEPIACDFVDENANGIIDATEDADTSTGPQEVIFTRLVFVGGDAPGCTDEENGCIQVTFRAVADNFAFAGPLQLCTGSQAVGDCDDGVQALDNSGNGDASSALQAGEEITYTTGLGLIVTAASGELALVNGEPAVDTDPIIRAYINWGNYASLPATEGPNDGESLEEAAAAEGGGGVWLLGDSVEVNGQTTIYADGDVTDENGFSVCTQ